MVENFKYLFLTVHTALFIVGTCLSISFPQNLISKYLELFGMRFNGSLFSEIEMNEINQVSYQGGILYERPPKLTRDRYFFEKIFNPSRYQRAYMKNLCDTTDRAKLHFVVLRGGKSGLRSESHLFSCTKRFSGDG